MKENVFRGLIETFVDEMRERTHGDNVLVVVSWKRNESDHSLSTSINLKEYMMAQMA